MVRDMLYWKRWVHKILVWTVLMAFAFAMAWVWIGHGLFQKKEGSIVNIYNWQGYLPDSLLKDFEKETGVHVNYSVFENEAALESRLFTGMVGFDVVFPSAWPQFARCLHLYQPLDYTKLPNARFLDPALMKKLHDADPHNRYGVPYLWGSTGIGYSQKLLKHCCPDGPLDSWALFFEPRFAKQLARCRISVVDSFLDVFQGALLYMGLDPNSENIQDWDKAFRKIEKIRPYITSFGSFQLVKELAEGSICAVIGFSNEIAIAKEQLRQDPIQKDQIVYVLPKEGAKIWIDVMAIPKNALHAHNAHLFINFMLRPRNMAILSNTLRAANPVPKSAPWLDPTLLEDESIFPPPHVVEKLFTDKVRSAEFYRKLLKYWFRIKVGWQDPQNDPKKDQKDY
jgi:putrescine transport system substrate-binding protein